MFPFDWLFFDLKNGNLTHCKSSRQRCSAFPTTQLIRIYAQIGIAVISKLPDSAVEVPSASTLLSDFAGEPLETPAENASIRRIRNAAGSIKNKLSQSISEEPISRHAGTFRLGTSHP